MKLSVIMPAHNHAAYVGTALRSILDQRDEAELDVVVVDDGSADGTAAIVEAIAAEAGCVRLVRQDNSGVTAARNVGLAHLPPDAELVTFLDSDDLWPAGRLRSDLAHFRRQPALELVYGMMRLADGIDEDRFDVAVGSREVTVRGISLSAGIYRRSALDRTGRFDPDFVQAEDADFLFRLFERRPPNVLTDQVAVIYRRHGSNTTRDTAQLRRSLMHALHKSVRRRRADPSLQSFDGVFDVRALQGEGRF
jgi:glycosyltransferase involved in cell wall biosynthesis